VQLAEPTGPETSQQLNATRELDRFPGTRASAELQAVHDVDEVGAGPAGLGAVLCAGRENRSVACGHTGNR